MKKTQQQMLRETEEALTDLETGRIVPGEKVMQWLETWGTDDEITIGPNGRSPLQTNPIFKKKK
ncbi:MAG: hypothetical protein AAGA80_01360 [Cyanobacteria bacterium P01_F01_bin.143]